MAIRIERSFRVDAAPDQVMAAMRDPALIEESERSRDALSVEVKDVVRTDAVHEYEVHVVSHARSVTGIDRTKTEKNKTRVTWSLAERSAKWSWSGEHAAVKLSGGYRLELDGAETVLHLAADIQVAIPLAGRVVEKKLESGFDAQWPLYVRRVERFARARAST